MIDEKTTEERYGYTSDELKPQSGKPIVAICDGCGVERTVAKAHYNGMCKSCAQKKRKPFSEDHKRKLSEAHKGIHLSEDHKRKISGAQKGKIVSEETRRKLSKALKNRAPPTEETKRKISEAKKGKPVSEETRRKLSKALKGKKRKPVSEETRRKISETLKGKKRKPFSEDHKRKISEAKKGKPHSEDRKRKLSEAQRVRWAKSMPAVDRVRHNYPSLMQEDEYDNDEYHYLNDKEMRSGCDDIPENERAY